MTTKLANRKSKPELDRFLPFVNRRKRPGLYLLLGETMDAKHAFHVQQALLGRDFEQLDIIIHSGGGDINAAYKIARILRNHAKSVSACVPLYAKSAATLLCISADEILLDEFAELGPLDTQVLEERKGGKRAYSSALNPFKTLEQLQAFSLETLDMAMKMITRRSGLGLDECLKHATDFVRVTSDPLLRQLNVEQLGEYHRALSIGLAYGERLLRKIPKWSDDARRRSVLNRLVYEYPSHGYVIDCQELMDLGFEAKGLLPEEATDLHGMFRGHNPNEDCVRLVLPTEGTSDGGDDQT